MTISLKVRLPISRFPCCRTRGRQQQQRILLSDSTSKQIGKHTHTQHGITGEQWISFNPNSGDGFGTFDIAAHTAHAEIGDAHR